MNETKPEETLTTKTFCRICVAFCGIDVITQGGSVTRILPDKSHPYNWRDYCAKGATANLVRDHPKRLRSPMKRVGDVYVPVSYETAITEIAARLNEIRTKYGADSIATYIGNPGQSNSPNHFFHGAFAAAIGTFNNYTVGSIDQNNFNRVAAELYGCEAATLIPDVDHAKCFLLLGTNPAVSNMAWMDTVPQGWKRVLAAKEAGADLIIVDPRETPSTRKATTHVVIRPGQDWALLLGVIKVVFEDSLHHREDCAGARDVDVIRTIAEQTSLISLADRCGVTVAQIRDVAWRFASAATAVCVARTGVAHHRNGTLGEWLSHVLNLITGRIDRKGGRFYQPGVFKNSMQLLNKLAPPVTRRSRIGNHPYVAGGYPMAILADEIQTPGAGQIHALIINSGNPVVSGPNGGRLDAALKELDLLIAIDLFQRESHRHAHWLIPGCHFLEREEFFALFSTLFATSFAQLGRKAVEPLNGIWPEWRFLRDLAVEMKAPFMGMRGLNSIIRVSRLLARLTGNRNHAFNPRWIWSLLLKLYGVVDWKAIKAAPQGLIYRKDEEVYGHFHRSLQTSDGKIHAAPPEFVASLKLRLQEPAPEATAEYPFQLVSQRRASMMNSWLVETSHHTRVFGEDVDINPIDALSRGITNGQQVRLSSRVSHVDAKARVTDEVPVGILSMDHGWGSRLFDPQGGAPPEVRGAMRNRLVAADELDELSGTPNLTGTYVAITPSP